MLQKNQKHLQAQLSINSNNNESNKRNLENGGKAQAFILLLFRYSNGNL